MTKIIDFAKLDFAALRSSVDMETRADLLAMDGKFGEASFVMKEANRIREGQFGHWPPNELRDFTNLALAQGMAPEGRGREGGPGSSELPSPVAESDAPKDSSE